MKSDRRHELQHNVLADTLGEVTVKAKPYSRMIVGFAVLLFALAVAYVFVSGKGKDKIATGWDEYFEAVNSGDREQLTEISEKYAGTDVAPWARIVAADMALSEGVSRLFSEKTQGRDLLKQAVNNFQTVLSEASDETLKQRSLYGLGRAHEALASVDDLTKAREDYKKLAEGWPEGVYAVSAKARLADLERSGTKQFYDWFAKYEPPKAVSPSGKKPDFLEENLDSDVKLPSTVDDLKIDGPKIVPDEGPSDIELPDEPKTEAKPDAAIEAPAEPKTETPPSAEPPVETVPAETKPENPAEAAPAETPEK